MGDKTERSQEGATEVAREQWGGGEHGVLMDGDRQHLVGRISIGQEIDKGDIQTTGDRSPGSGRAKLGREITTEWS